MSSAVITMRRGGGDLSAVAETLRHDLIANANAELLCVKSHGTAGAQAILVSCEKFFFRNGSYASLNILLTDFDGVQTADIVGSGGGEGLFNVSWFANQDFAENAEKILKEYGFSTVEKKT